MASEKIVTESALAALASDAKRAIYDVLPGGSASGDVATFDTDIAVPLKSLIANITASGGNGTPATPIPIVGHSELNLVRCGTNLWDEAYEIGSIDPSTGANNDYATDTLRSKNYIPVVPNISIRVPLGTNPNYICWNNIYTYDRDKNFLGLALVTNDVVTIPSDCFFIRFRTVIAYGTTYNNDISINYPSTDTTYHAYNGDTFTVQFGQTVYGGVYDANRGKVRLTHGYLLIDENTPSMSYNGATSNTVRAFVDVTGKAFGDSNILSDRFQLLEGDVVGRFTGRNNSNGVEFYLPANVTPTTAGVKAWFETNNTQLVYELATPIEIDVAELSVDTIVGVNNVFGDTGEVEVEYRESVEKYVTEHGGGASWTDVVGTLTAGSTSITLSNAAIKTTSTINVYTDPGIPYNTLAVSSGQAVLTFDAQAGDVSVKVRVT